jgi:signal transduction histidine kinase
MLSVVNGGEPIPEEILGQLFQPFFRGAARPSPNGHGLGLFIASEIAKAHGGWLEVASSAEATRFTLTMPARKPSA